MDNDFLEKSRSYMQEGQLEKAQVLLRRALHESPNSARALELSGDLAQRMGKRSEAVTRYEQAAAIYGENDQLLEAIICHEKVAKIERTNSDRYVHLTQLYRQAGLPNQGIQKMIDLCSRSIDNKDETTFITGLRKIVELQPENLQLGLSYVRILMAMNRGDQAEEELNRLKSVATEKNDQGILKEISRLLPQTDGGDEGLDPKSRVELGNLLYEIGSKDEALVEFNRAVSDLVEQGEPLEAIKVLNRIVEIDPGNESAFDKLRELQALTGTAPQEKIEEREIDLSEVPEKPAEAPAEEGVEVPAAEGVREVVTEGQERTDIPEQSLDEEDISAGTAEKGTETIEQSEQAVVEEPAYTEAGLKDESIADTAAPAEGIFDDLIREVENYVDRAQKEKGTETVEKEIEEPPTLEGQIADIEFLLKEMEAPPAPSFEVASEFDEFRGNIRWEEEDVGKRLELAQQAFDAELYETALTHAHELKINKHTWPLSLELTGAAMIKLGKYSEAIKTVGPAILLEDIPQDEKIELRYLLASAYQGMGDFDNALREIEHIMSTEPDYKDVREMYELLGGTSVVSKSPPKIKPAREEKPVEKTEEIEEKAEEPEIVKPQEPEPAKVPKETYDEKPAPEPEEEEPYEQRGENISFL
jgi:tetratricopeptide (TPR) repeat protein